MKENNYSDVFECFKIFVEDLNKDENGFYVTVESEAIQLNKHIDDVNVNVDMVDDCIVLSDDEDNTLKINEEYLRNVIIESSCIVINFDHLVIALEKY